MRIKIDEDLPKGVAEAVRGVVPDTLTVIEEGLSGVLDAALWGSAQKEQRFLITGDKAFANIKQHPPGTHAGVLLLRSSNHLVRNSNFLLSLDPWREGCSEKTFRYRYSGGACLNMHRGRLFFLPVSLKARQEPDPSCD